MEQIIFKDYAELGNSMYEIASGDGESITAVLPCDDAVFIMRWLLEYEDIDVGNIQISEDYDDEYYVTIDEFLFLNIKPVKDKQGNIIVENTDIMLFDGLVPNSIALHNKNCRQYEICYEKENDLCRECCSDCSNCNRQEVAEALQMALDYLNYLIDHNE